MNPPHPPYLYSSHYLIVGDVVIAALKDYQFEVSSFSGSGMDFTGYGSNYIDSGGM
jgi:hypothetical protein